jgi:hypothetical protein
MAGLLAEIQEHAPEAGFYMEDCGNPYLMGGPTHVGNRFSPRACHENVIVLGETWFRSSGGGW